MQFLLLDGADDSYWKAWLIETLTPLGILRVAPADTGVPNADAEPDGLIIIDATAVEDVEELVSRLRTERPERRIVVVTASPDWVHARAAFEAGAADYLPKTLSPKQLLETFQRLLQRPLPPWQH